MGWYFVTKRIGGKPYKYRQRTYREGGKVRTQCQYVCALSDSAVTGTAPTPTVKAELPEEPLEFGNPLLPKEPGTIEINWPKVPSSYNPVGSFATDEAEIIFAKRNVSAIALNAEYDRVGNFLEHLGIDKKSMPRFEIKASNKTGWKRKRGKYEVRLNLTGKTSGRNQFKQNYRFALAHALLDRIEEDRPILFDYLRTYLDQSYFNTKWVVSMQMLKSKHKGKFGLTLQFLWSGKLPISLEKQFGVKSSKKNSLFKSAGWRDDAAGMIAEVIKRGVKPSAKQMLKDKKRAASNAKRAFNQYYKLGRVARLTPKGRKIWKRYKKHQASYLVAHQRSARFEAIMPFLAKMHH